MPRPPTYPELYDDAWLAERERYGPQHIAVELGCGESTAGLALAAYRRRKRVRRQRVALPPSVEAVADDVEFRVAQDAARDTVASSELLINRCVAVLEAEAWHTPFPLRDALIDLAAAAQAWAGRLPTPTVSAQQPTRTR